jgi:dihydrofolate reductase
MFAIAAMSKNRVIGNGNAIPWRIPEEFKWFRRMTLGRVVIMGRRTFESLAKPLDGRVNVVLTRHPARLRADPKLKDWFGHALVGSAAHAAPQIAQLSLPKLPRTEVRLARSIDSLDRAGVTRDAWLCGGAHVYAQFLRRCSELYLSVIDREVEGDARFPPFEHLFDFVDVAVASPEFRVLHYVRNQVSEGLEDLPGASVAAEALAPSKLGTCAVDPLHKP